MLEFRYKGVFMEENSDYLFSNIKYFCFTVISLVLFGLIMVYSSSYIYAKEVYGTSSYYFTRQLYFVLIGLGIAFAIGKTKIDFWVKYGMHINIVASLFLFLTVIPGLSSDAKGATRWVQLFGMRFQPGEIIKFTVILSSVSFFENWNITTVKKRCWHLLSLFVPLVLIIIQPDFGTFSICLLALLFCCFMSGFSRKYLYMAAASGLVVSSILLFSQPYRVKRILAFLDPWKNAKTSGFQIIQSYLAFANGSIFGQGLGNSTEKLFYLPEAHNDFIFSIVGAELGFVGVLFSLVLFMLFVYFGFKAALALKNRLHTVLLSSVIFCIGIQAFLNMAVVLGLLPTKGLNLPFISSGGSSLFSNAFGIGLILSAARHSIKLSENYQNSLPSYGAQVDTPRLNETSRLPL